MTKRIFDLLFASVLLVIFAPVLVVVSLVIKLTSRGPVFYRGERVGFRGTAFRIFKFRSMVVDAETLGGSSTAGDDARITGIGKVIRKLKLDELPQLLNVIRGDMSLVGPRPEVRQYTDMYTAEEKGILELRPGITDWASLWNCDEGAILAASDDPERDYLEKIRPEKIRLQLAYLRKRTFGVDVMILWQTLLAVVLRRKPEAAAISESTKAEAPPERASAAS